MRDHSENTLRAAIKCLNTTVAQALDPTDPQAAEQLRLTVEFLDFLRTRLYDLHARARYELAHRIKVAEEIAADSAQVSARAREAIAATLTRARRTFADPDAHTLEVQTVSDELWACVRGVLREASDVPDELRVRISEQVLAGLEPLIDLETSWYLPFGFVPDPTSALSLEDLLRSTSRSAS